MHIQNGRTDVYLLKTGAMNKQFCKVGAIHPLAEGRQGIALLENQYQYFLDRAAEVKATNAQFGDFLERKAQKIERLLDSLL